MEYRNELTAPGGARETRPPVDGHEPVQSAAFRTKIAALGATWVNNATPSESRRRVRATVRVYETLLGLGVDLTSDVGSLRERHATMLLAHWRGQGLAEGTIRNYWTLLLGWTMTLGKVGMLGRLEDYWPELTQGTDAKGVQSKRREAWALTDWEMRELMRARDRTHWLLARLQQELGLSVAEALLLDAKACVRQPWGYIEIPIQKAQAIGLRAVRRVELETPSKMTLIEDVLAYLDKRGRPRLLWKGISLPTAIRSHENRRSYLRRKNLAQQASQASRQEVLS